MWILKPMCDTVFIQNKYLCRDNSIVTERGTFSEPTGCFNSIYSFAFTVPEVCDLIFMADYFAVAVQRLWLLCLLKSKAIKSAKASCFWWLSCVVKKENVVIFFNFSFYLHGFVWQSNVMKRSCLFLVSLPFIQFSLKPRCWCFFVIKVEFYCLRWLMTTETEKNWMKNSKDCKVYCSGNHVLSFLLCYHKLQWHFGVEFTNEQIFALNSIILLCSE